MSTNEDAAPASPDQEQPETPASAADPVSAGGDGGTTPRPKRAPAAEPAAARSSGTRATRKAATSQGKRTGDAEPTSSSATSPAPKRATRTSSAKASAPSSTAAAPASESAPADQGATSAAPNASAAPGGDVPGSAAPESSASVVPTPAEAAASSTPAPSPGRRVVVAEDEALIRLDVVETLTEAGFDVVGEAGDGETAVALATEVRPDVVVMDIKMPILDGISAAERIGKARIAPVVLLTAFSQAELVERARDAGAMAYVVKPFTPGDLLPAIEIAVARHQQITALEAEVADLAERFETRKRVDRAKGLLMTKMGLTEPESFRWIQKTSMDRRLTMREVADAVIDQVGSADRSR